MNNFKLLKISPLFCVLAGVAVQRISNLSSATNLTIQIILAIIAIFCYVLLRKKQAYNEKKKRQDIMLAISLLCTIFIAIYFYSSF